MILAIEIGNTNTVIGCIDEKKLYFVERISTSKSKTELEYAVDIKMILDLHAVSANNIEGSIIASVVPQVTGTFKAAAEKILGKSPLVVGPGVKNGMNIKIDNPGQMGSDLVAVAVAGIDSYQVPLVIFNLGTATTVCVIDSDKNYIGGMIMPGIKTSMTALAQNASMLNEISLEAPRHLIGRSTIESMKSGIIYSNACCIDGLLERIEEELGQKVTAISTGGLCRYIIPHCKRKIIIDDELTLKGLLIIYRKNRS